MLVKTQPEWLALPVPERFERLEQHVTPLLRKYAENVRLRHYDSEFYSARISDIWIWEIQDRRAYERMIEEFRETPFWDRYFAIIEILPAVENAYASNYGRQPIS